MSCLRVPLSCRHLAGRRAGITCRHHSRAVVPSWAGVPSLSRRRAAVMPSVAGEQRAVVPLYCHRRALTPSLCRSRTGGVIIQWQTQIPLVSLRRAVVVCSRAVIYHMPSQHAVVPQCHRRVRSWGRVPSSTSCRHRAAVMPQSCRRAVVVPLRRAIVVPSSCRHRAVDLCHRMPRRCAQCAAVLPRGMPSFCAAVGVLPCRRITGGFIIQWQIQRPLVSLRCAPSSCCRRAVITWMPSSYN